MSAGGVLLGIGGAVALTRVMGLLVYGATTTDPLTLAAVPLILIAVAALASLVPAWRAARVEPLLALRTE